MRCACCLLLLLTWSLVAYASPNATDDTPLRVTSILVPPYLIAKPSNSISKATSSNDTSANDTGANDTSGNATAGENEFEGFIVSVLDGIAEIIGRTYEIKLVEDGKYGRVQGADITGMIGEVNRGVADVAAAPLIVTLNRETAVDFTFPFRSFEASAVMSRRHPAQTPVINDINDLVEQDTVDYGVLRGGAIANHLETSAIELHMRIWQNMTGKPYVFRDTNQAGVDRARSDSNYAFILEGSLADYAASKQPCDLEVVRTGFYKRQYAFAVPNQSPLRDQLNEAIVQLQSSGQMDEYYHEWFGDDECTSVAPSMTPRVTTLSVLLLVVVTILT